MSFKTITMLSILIILNLSLGVLSMPTGSPNNVEILMVGEDYVELRFPAVDNVDFYTVEATLSDADDYDENPLVSIVTPEDTSSEYVTVNVTGNLNSSRQYEVTVYANIGPNGEIRQWFLSRGSFTSNACESGFECARLDAPGQQCLRNEWMCNGILECGDEIDEEACDIEIASPGDNGSRCVQENETARLWYDENPDSDTNGTRKPRCEPDGSYSPVQCYKNLQNNTDECSCVDKEGNELYTEQFYFGGNYFFVFKYDCESLRDQDNNGDEIASPGGNRSRCIQEKETARLWYDENPDSDTNGPRKPGCEPDGSYSPVQCYKNLQNNTNECSCVDKEGNVLYTKQFHFGGNYFFVFKHDCESLRDQDNNGDEIASPGDNRSRCVQEKETARLWYNENPDSDTNGPRKPGCEPDGSYSPVQCYKNLQNNTNECSCVDKEGNVLYTEQFYFGGLHYFYLFKYDCESLRDQDNNGDEIASPGNNRSRCVQEKETARLWYDENPDSDTNGPRKPGCEPDGSYSPVQCYINLQNNTNECSCVDKEGNELYTKQFQFGGHYSFFFKYDCESLRDQDNDGDD